MRRRSGNDVVPMPVSGPCVHIPVSCVHVAWEFVDEIARDITARKRARLHFAAGVHA